MKYFILYIIQFRYFTQIWWILLQLCSAEHKDLGVVRAFWKVLEILFKYMYVFITIFWFSIIPQNMYVNINLYELHMHIHSMLRRITLPYYPHWTFHTQNLGIFKIRILWTFSFYTNIQYHYNVLFTFVRIILM